MSPGSMTTDTVRDFLTAHVKGEISDVVRIAHGEWSKAFTFRHDGGDYIIRFSALEEDFAKDRFAARFASPELPIPQVMEIGTAFDGFYAISERAFGAYLDELGTADMRRLLPALFATLDAVRLVDLRATTGFGGWDAHGQSQQPSWRASLLEIADDRPTHRIQGWRERLATSPTGSKPFESALEQLTTLVHVCPEDRHLIHSDLLNYNVLVSDDHIAAVIDWGCGKYGDFLYDLAWLSFWSPWYPAWESIDFRQEAARHYASIGLDVPHFEERLRCYEIHIGLDSQAYNSYKGRWNELDVVAKRTLKIARSH